MQFLSILDYIIWGKQMKKKKTIWFLKCKKLALTTYSNPFPMVWIFNYASRYIFLSASGSLMQWLVQAQCVFSSFCRTQMMSLIAINNKCALMMDELISAATQVVSFGFQQSVWANGSTAAACGSLVLPADLGAASLSCSKGANSIFLLPSQVTASLLISFF